MKKFAILIVSLMGLVGCDESGAVVTQKTYKCDHPDIFKKIESIISEEMERASMGVYNTTNMKFSDITQRDSVRSDKVKVCTAMARYDVVYLKRNSRQVSNPITYTVQRGTNNGEDTPVVYIYKIGAKSFGQLTD